jgi:[NiFe] hydrogenase diaphorase moiety large subunit
MLCWRKKTGADKMLVAEKNSISQEIELHVSRYGADRTSLLPILQEIQRKHNYISEFAQQEVARLLEIHPVEVHSVITFYAFLNSEPRGRNIVRLCQTITCDLFGKRKVADAIEAELGIRFGETTSDNKFTLEYANCLGMCDQGPAMLVNEKVYSNLTPESAAKILKNFKKKL